MNSGSNSRAAQGSKRPTTQRNATGIGVDDGMAWDSKTRGTDDGRRRRGQNEEFEFAAETQNATHVRAAARIRADAVLR